MLAIYVCIYVCMYIYYITYVIHIFARACYYVVPPNYRCMKGTTSLGCSVPSGQQREVRREGLEAAGRQGLRLGCSSHRQLTLACLCKNNASGRLAGNLGFCFKVGKSVLQTANIFFSKMGRWGWHLRYSAIWTQTLSPNLSQISAWGGGSSAPSCCSPTVSQKHNADLCVSIAGCKRVAQLPNPACRRVLFYLRVLCVAFFFFFKWANILKNLKISHNSYSGISWKKKKSHNLATLFHPHMVTTSLGGWCGISS